MDICFIAIRTRTSTEDLYPIYKLLILCSVFDYGWLNTRDSMEKTIMDICFIAIRTRTSTEDLYPIYKLLILCSVFFCFFFLFFFFTTSLSGYGPRWMDVLVIYHFGTN